MEALRTVSDCRRSDNDKPYFFNFSINNRFNKYIVVVDRTAIDSGSIPIAIQTLSGGDYKLKMRKEDTVFILKVKIMVCLPASLPVGQ